MSGRWRVIASGASAASGGLLALVLLGACESGNGSRDGSATVDGGMQDLSLLSDGAAPVAAGFTVVGCSKLEAVAGVTSCSGGAPLELTFVPVSDGVTVFVWTFNGGNPTTSKAITPAVRFQTPGVYMVSLAAGGPFGTAVSMGRVIVSEGNVGAPCTEVAQCAVNSGLTCVCGAGTCPGALSFGLCTHSCGPTGCGGNEVCADLTRGSPPTDGGLSGAPWRTAMCLAGCISSSECRPGFSCREVPGLMAGEMPGGAFTWQRACFADLLSDIGDVCITAASTFADANCLSGRCGAFGARGLCTAGCVTNADCPSYAACVTFNGTPTQGTCLARCGTEHLCDGDPLLDCQTAGGLGALGFSVPTGGSASATYCAPKRCLQPSDCAPAGSCTAMGSASFCIK